MHYAQYMIADKVTKDCVTGLCIYYTTFFIILEYALAYIFCPEGIQPCTMKNRDIY